MTSNIGISIIFCDIQKLFLDSIFSEWIAFNYYIIGYSDFLIMIKIFRIWYNKYHNRYTWSISSRFKVVYVSNPKCFHPSKKSSHQEQWWSNFCRVHLGKKGKPHKKSFLCFLNVKLANRKVFSFGLYIIQNISCRNF